MTPSRPLFAALCCILASFSSTAFAQRTPTRAQFEQAALAYAASEATNAPCHDSEGEGSTATIPTPKRARMVGRQVPLGARPAQRRAAIVLVATSTGDANGDLAHDLYVVVLQRVEQTWGRPASVEIPLGRAPYAYDDAPVVRIARVEDVDDDGEGELLVVISTHTEVQCGTGYCSQRRTAILDIEAAPVLVANEETSAGCQGDVMDRVNGSTVFQDANGDGHRDLLIRRQVCPGMTDNDEGEWVEQPCNPRVTQVRLWNQASDRYGPPTVLAP